MGRAVLNATFSGAHNSAQRVLSLEDFVAGFVQNIFRRITKQVFGGGVPETNLTFKCYDKRRIRCSLQQLIYIAGKHLPLLHARTSALQADSQAISVRHPLAKHSTLRTPCITVVPPRMTGGSIVFRIAIGSQCSPEAGLVSPLEWSRMERRSFKCWQAVEQFIGSYIGLLLNGLDAEVYWESK